MRGAEAGERRVYGTRAVYRRRIRIFMAEYGIWRIEELDYDWRYVAMNDGVRE